MSAAGKDSKVIVTASAIAGASASGSIVRELVGGVDTETYTLPATAAPAGDVDWCAVVLPGNPGTVHYYVPFIHQLFDRCGGRFTVRGVSLAGHSAVIDSTDLSRVYLLNDQIEHVAAYLDVLTTAHARAHPTRRIRFVLLGHSIGSHIGLHAMLRRPALDIAQCVCLFPFIRFDLSAVQNTAFRLLFALRPLLVAFIRLAAYLPMSVRRLLLRILTDIRAEFAIAVTTRVFFHPYSLTNGLQLGEDEFNRVPRAFDMPLYRAIAHKLTFYYTSIFDHWAPPQQFEYLRKELNGTGARFHLFDSVRHAFVVYPKEYELVASTAAARITELVLHSSPPAQHAATAAASTVLSNPTYHKSYL